MKYLIAIFMLTAACTSTQKINYTTTQTPKEKALIGVINRNIIDTDTTFKWFGLNYKYANPDADAVATIKAHKNKFKLIVFGGTWCEDTQALLPTFYKLIDKSEYDEKRITLVGVDRQKSSGNELSGKFNIKNVPTFIVLNKKGEEVGRVVEYGKGNGIYKEIAEVITKSFGH